MDISLGEVIRRLEDIVKRQDAMLAEIRQDRHHFEKTYVRKDVHEEQIKSLTNEVEDIEKKLSAQDAFRKQIISGVSVGAIMLMITMFIAISNFIAVKK